MILSELQDLKMTTKYSSAGPNSLENCLNNEILILNNTILDNGRRIFTYFWDVCDVDDMKPRTYIQTESASFTILGKKSARLYFHSSSCVIFKVNL